jgi:hypothetical protein
MYVVSQQLFKGLLIRKRHVASPFGDSKYKESVKISVVIATIYLKGLLIKKRDLQQV